MVVGALRAARAPLHVLAASLRCSGRRSHAFRLRALQLAVGILLLFFGMRWLRKAVLRYAGAIALHDERAIYERRRRALGDGAPHRSSVDPLGFATAFQAVAVEGLEVIFIVIAVGASARALAGSQRRRSAGRLRRDRRRRRVARAALAHS